VSLEPEPDIRPGRDNESDRAASMRLRAERPRVTRLSRKVLAGGAAIGSLAICGAVLWALQNNRSHTSVPSELYTTDHHNVADGLTGLPRDYAGVPSQVPPLGPALPGDLGRPIMNAQSVLSGAIPSPDGEQQRIGQEIEAARLSKLFASTSIRELALPSIQPASSDSAAVTSNQPGQSAQSAVDDTFTQNGQDRKLAS
jgi:type IV secretory pathway VirB10-like protein